jgi:hypothetical protein
VLLPFIKEGIEQGERAFHVINPGLRAEHVRRLGAAGIEVAAKGRGRLEVRGWDEVHLWGDHFDLDAWLRLLEAVLSGTHLAGPLAVRVVIDKGWMLEHFTGVDDILEYESLCNDVAGRFAQPIICAYDLTRFSAGLIIDILRTHSIVLLGYILRENPFFVPPQEFLQELRERRDHDPPA